MNTNRSTALEHVRPGANVPAQVMDFDTMREQARFLSTTGMVPVALQGEENADKIVVVGLLGQELGVPFMAAVSEIHVIEGKASPSAQLRLALIRRAGHEANFVSSSAEKAVIRGRRREHRNDPNGWVVVEWTIEDARRAGLLDEMAQKFEKEGQKWRMVEQIPLARDASGKYVHRDTGGPLPQWAAKQVESGRIKKKENWHRYPAEMLRARAASALCRMHFSDVLAGLGSTEFTAEELGFDTDQDLDERPEFIPATSHEDEPADDEIVVDPDAARPADRYGEIPDTSEHAKPQTFSEFAKDAGRLANPEPVEEADDFDRIALTKRFEDFLPEFRAIAWERWKAAKLPPPPEYPSMTKTQVDEAQKLLFDVLRASDEEYGRRRRKAFAVMGKVGIKAEAERHALVKRLTGGRTESTSKLTETEVDAIEAYCKQVEAEAAKAAAPASAPAAPAYGGDPFAGLPEPPEYDADDPGRPFTD